MSSNNSRNLTPSGVCSPTTPNSFPPHVPLIQRQFACENQGSRKPENTKEVGYFCEWDNGEQLSHIVHCHITIGGQTTTHRLMDGKSLFQPAPPGEYEAQLLQDVNTEEKLNEARQQLQKALDAIIEHEKKEAAALKKIQDGQHAAIRATYHLLAMARGFGNSGVEFVKSTKELSDLVNPMTPLKNALASAWSAKRNDGTSWTQSFLQNYSNEQKRELAEVLGFHPDDISREQIAEAYNTACFIYDDIDSRKILKQFAVTYIEVQNIQEKMEFTGSILFEIVLNILLAALTGGVGNAARIAVSAPLLKLLNPLKDALENLSKWIVNHTVKSGSYVKGMTGAEAVPVTLRRPREIIPDDISSSSPEPAARPALNPGDDAVSPERYKALRAKTPSREMQRKVNEGVTLPMDDPALPGLQITSRLHADHIVPMKKITEMNGFSRLNFENQVEVLNHPNNFQALSGAANQSKGSKSFTEWKRYKKGDIEVEPNFRNSMIEKTKIIEKELQQKIQDLLSKQGE